MQNGETDQTELDGGGDATDPRESAGYARSLLEASLDPLVTISPKGKITDVNEATVRVTGRSREQFIGTDFSDYFTEPDSARRGYRAVFAEGSVTDYPLTIRDREGRLTDVLYNASVYKDEEGNVQGVFAAARDISERKRMEQRLVRSEEHFRALIENSSDLVAVIDGAGIFKFQSPSSKLILGYDPEELVGRSVFDFIHPDDLGPIKDRFAELAGGRREPTRSTELRFRHKDSSWRVLEVKGRELPGTAGEISFVLNSRDVTERREAEQILRLTRFALDRAADLVHWLDSEGRIVDVNESSCRKYGYSREEMLGLEVLDLDPALSPDSWPERWEEIKSRGSVTLERTHRTKEGDLFPVEVTSNHIEHDGREYDVAFLRDITERKRAEEALQTAKDYAERLIQTADAMVLGLDLEGRVILVNDATLAVTGYSRDELLGQSWSLVVPPDHYPVPWEEFDRLSAGEISGRYENPIVTKSGEERHIIWQNNVVCEQGEVVSTISFGIDVTERKRAEEALRESEEQLRQAQKMDAVGQLAGGIAHDFNNVLTAIIGYSDLILSSQECAEGSLRADVQEIKSAAERASALTRQILAFSRRQALQPEVLSLNEVLGDMERMLRRTLGEDIELVTVLDPELGLVEVDAGQLGQVLVNLALNARDAMPTGGTLNIKTANVELSSQECGGLPGCTPGSYVLVVVSDTGVGMDDETMSHAFEPFFTTKDPGKGTGLGLSTVYGVVKQSGGCIFAHSEPGQGATFQIYLPRVEKPAKEGPGATSMPESVAGDETILVVEDETAVRELVRRVLEHLGYAVLTAGNGDEALTLLKNESSPVDLLLTDVVLPGTLRGNELALAARVLWPSLPVLYMSGYARDAIVHSGRLDQGLNHIEKPFTPDQLALRVREVLDSESQAG